MPTRRWVFFGILAALSFAGCGGTSEEGIPSQGTSPASEPLSEQAQFLVSEGNAAQRAGRYEEALDFFGQALEMHPNHPVPQFGSLMAAMAVGDTALARSLREKLAVTGPDLLEMLGPGGGMAPTDPGASHLPGGGMPPGHPAVEAPPTDTLVPNPARRG
jgi:hypothetical protein